MNLFSLKICTPSGLIFDGSVYQVSIRSIDGDISILANHIPYLTVIKSGECKILKSQGDPPIIYDCNNGFLIVTKNSVNINLEYCLLNNS